MREQRADWLGCLRVHIDHVVESIAASQLLPDVVAAIAELPEGERDALVLHAWEHLGYDEIAAALDIPIGTVMSRLSRAREKLRRIATEPVPLKIVK